jgi:sugar lactone lactonase YvrE
MKRRRFLQVGISLSAALVAHAHEHHVLQARAEDNQGGEAPPPSGPITGGSGEFRYEYVPGKLKLPTEVKMRHGHGLCRDAAGNIYFTYEPEKVEPQTRCLVRFNPDGTGAELLGTDNALAHGAPHGLNIDEADGTGTFLYHANNDATVHKTTLDGKVLWTQKWSPQMGNYKPTDAVAPPGSDRVLIADGYGSSMIHALKKPDGVYAGKSWGGMGANHGELNCPHGITFDPRRKLLLAADRGNKRLEYFNLNGSYHSTIEAKEITAPCNADVWGDYVLVPDLDGPLIILDKENRAISMIEVGKLLGHQGFKHPHDAIFLANGDIAVCTWNPGRLGYWKRLT